MRLIRVALFLATLPALPAWASGPYWHRSATLDYRVAADGASVSSETWEVRADTNAIAQIIAQQSFSAIADLEQVDLVAAYTRKPDGRTLPVSPGSVMDKAVTTTASGPQFSALTVRTIVFPQVSAGDTIHYELRRTTKETMFPGEFTLNLEFGGAATADRVEVGITLAPGRLLHAGGTGLAELPVETEADGFVTHRWRMAPKASGTIALEASTFSDYEALGRAYAARAAGRAVPGPGIAALADRLAPGGTDPRETVMRLYRYVASEIRYVAVFLREGRVVPRDAETVLAEGWGDCKDHTALLQALLAAKGIEVVPALISLHSRYDLPAVPGLGALDHVIAYVPSLDLYLDSTAPYAPFGLLLAGEYDKPVVLADARAPRLGRTPAMPESGIALITRTEGRISADGVVSGRTTTIATGPQSIALRAMAAWFEGRGTAYAASTQLQLLGTPGTGRYAFDSPDNGDGVYQVAGEFVLDEPLAEGGAEPFSVPGGLGVFGRASCCSTPASPKMAACLLSRARGRGDHARAAERHDPADDAAGFQRPSRRGQLFRAVCRDRRRPHHPPRVPRHDVAPALSDPGVRSHARRAQRRPPRTAATGQPRARPATPRRRALEHKNSITSAQVIPPDRKML